MEDKPDKMKLWLVVIIWLLLQELSTLKIMLLQLPFFLDVNSAKRGIVEEELKWKLDEKFPHLIMGNWRRKLKDQWEYPSSIGKLMSLKQACHWWKIS